MKHLVSPLEWNVTYEPEATAGGVPEMVREEGGEEEEAEPHEVPRDHPPHQEQQQQQEQRQAGAVQERSLRQGHRILSGKKGSTVKSPNFVTAYYFVTAAENFCEALIGF